MKAAAPIGDKAVMFVCILAAMFLVGFTAGENKPVAKICPQVEGMKVFSTAATKDGEYCYYTKQSTGYTTKKVRL